MFDYTGNDAGPFNDTVKLMELTDPVQGGLSGTSNASRKQLADNDAYLYKIMGGFESIVLKDNTGIASIAISEADIKRNLVVMQLTDDALFTGNMPASADVRVGGIVVIKRISATSDKAVQLQADGSDVFNDSYLASSSTLLLFNDDCVTLYNEGAGVWRVVHWHRSNGSPEVNQPISIVSGDISGNIYYKKNRANNTLHIRSALTSADTTVFAAPATPGYYTMMTLGATFRPTVRQYFTAVVTTSPTPDDGSGYYYFTLNGFVDTDGTVQIQWLQFLGASGTYSIKWNAILYLG